MSAIQNLMYSHGATKAKDETKDVYYTPSWFFNSLEDIFESAFHDPCPGSRPSPAYKSAGDAYAGIADGLLTNWKLIGLPAFVNPPFSEMQAWLDKIKLEADQGTTTLYFGKLDFRTKWGADLVNSFDFVMPVLGYVAYETEQCSPFPSATFQSCAAMVGPEAQKIKSNILKMYKGRFYCGR